MCIRDRLYTYPHPAGEKWSGTSAQRHAIWPKPINYAQKHAHELLYQCQITDLPTPLFSRMVFFCVGVYFGSVVFSEMLFPCLQDYYSPIILLQQHTFTIAMLVILYTVSIKVAYAVVSECKH